jgi:hypothetical protein
MAGEDRADMEADQLRPTGKLIMWDLFEGTEWLRVKLKVCRQYGEIQHL